MSDCLAKYPQGGGHWSALLQYLLGLDDLGHDVFWIDLLKSTGDPGRDAPLIASFFEQFGRLGFLDRCAVISHPGEPEDLVLETASIHNASLGEIRELARSADMLWNLCAAAREPFLSLFKFHVLIDLDPGQTQGYALTYNLDLISHEVLLSVGTKIRDEDCGVPRLNLSWHPFRPFVYLPAWQQAPDPGPDAPFCSITHWGWGGGVWIGDRHRLFSVSKREAYFRYLDLPRRCGRPFQLAANIPQPDETGDTELLRSHGWDLVDPYEVAGTPDAYRRYIATARGEVLCPKPIYRELRTGWLSDRSVAFLATGRPVLAEDTGFADHVPTGDGLIAFRDPDEAVAGVAEIDAHYDRHRRAARELAEEYFGSRRCLAEMLALCGMTAP